MNEYKFSMNLRSSSKLLNNSAFYGSLKLKAVFGLTFELFCLHHSNSKYHPINLMVTTQIKSIDVIFV